MPERIAKGNGKMPAVSRRGVFGLAFVGALGLTLPETAFASESALTLPQTPMKFRRRLERSLRDGERIVIEREWLLTFTRQGRGISVVGEQSAVWVDVPPKLARLADLERERSTAGMWPILLSQEGQIVAAGEGTAHDDLERALSIAKDMISQRSASGEMRASRMEDLALFEKAGSELMVRMPNDLFFPAAQPLHLVRSMDLPGGLTGEYEIIYTSRQSRSGQWLDRAQREVVTRIDSSEKRSREEWMMAPA